LVEIVEENGGRTISKTIKSGMSSIFPLGLLHYQFNLGCKPARLLAALSHEDAGALSFPTRLLTIKEATIATIFGTGSRGARAIKRSADLARIQRACLKRCGLA